MDNAEMLTPKEVGKRIKERRHEIGISMPELGRRVGVNKSTIQRYETDGVNPNRSMIINGPMGVGGVQKLSTFSSGVVLILITLFLVLNLIHSRTGRAIMAVRDNKIAAESIGLSVTRYKLLAFVISAVFAGMAGTLYAMNFSTVTASKFDFNTSILILVFVVLGGLGNIWGSIIAAALLTVLPELLRSMNDYRMLIYAILLIVMMIFNNSGAKKRLTEYFSAQKEKRTAKKAAGKGVN